MPCAKPASDSNGFNEIRTHCAVRRLPASPRTKSTRAPRPETLHSPRERSRPVCLPPDVAKTRASHTPALLLLQAPVDAADSNRRVLTRSAPPATLRRRVRATPLPHPIPTPAEQRERPIQTTAQQLR